jgi:membrane associated rhomboid family serine protease
MSLTLGHVTLVVLATVAGAVLGRAIRRRSARLRFLKEVVRAALFVLGIAAAVALAASSPGTGTAKAAAVGFYVGAAYGLFATDARVPRPTQDPPAQSGGGA